MLTTVYIPPLSDFLEAEGINAGQLYLALEAYADHLAQHIDLKHDAVAQPLEYLEIKDFEDTIQAFLQQLPKILPDEPDFVVEDEEDDD
ncbi:hypothetical protein GCM10027347_17620 [Larkinella harenae]